MVEVLHDKSGVLEKDEIGSSTGLLEQIMARVGPKLKKVGFGEIREEKKGDKSGFGGGGTGNFDPKFEKSI